MPNKGTEKTSKICNKKYLLILRLLANKYVGIHLGGADFCEEGGTENCPCTIQIGRRVWLEALAFLVMTIEGSIG